MWSRVEFVGEDHQIVVHPYRHGHWQTELLAPATESDIPLRSRIGIEAEAAGEVGSVAVSRGRGGLGLGGWFVGGESRSSTVLWSRSCVGRTTRTGEYRKAGRGGGLQREEEEREGGMGCGGGLVWCSVDEGKGVVLLGSGEEDASLPVPEQRAQAAKENANPRSC